MKVAILWTRLSGYMNVCIKELAQRDGVELLVCHIVPAEEAPFDENLFNWIPNRIPWRSEADLVSLEERLTAFGPDVLIFTGWHIGPYRRLARRFRNRSLRVMTMDNPWRASLKQCAGVLFASYYVGPLADAVWLPGERQAVFAAKMGFKQGSILRGLYSCDQQRMAAVHLARVAAQKPVPRKFIFVGRFVEDKGVDTLVKAYQLYRNSQANPWPLLCCGTGPMGSMLEGKDGIQVEGFVQPDQMPAKLAAAGCLILPSVFEPWALVVHEAASAGLLILASQNVGAAVHLVQPNYNGFIAGNRDAKGLAELMCRIGAMSDERLNNMSRASYCLSQQFSPSRWTDTIIESFHAWPKREHVC